MSNPTEPVHHRFRNGLLAIRLQAFGFIIGSMLFALGAISAQFDPTGFGLANGEFAVGAMFFTAASSVQFWISERGRMRTQGVWQQLRTSLQDVDVLSSALQLVGTVYFNVMTLRALVDVYVDQTQANHAIWRPDLIGSMLFLASSLIAFMPVSRQRRHEHVMRRSTWICLFNVAGSLAFGISAIASFYTPGGDVLSATWANATTFAGGIFFLLGAALLLPRWQSKADARANELVGPPAV